MLEVSTTPAPGATDSPAPDAGPTAARHLIVLILDCLTMPDPAPDPEDEAAYLRLAARRSMVARDACRTALGSTTEQGLWRAAERLYSAVSDLPVVYAPRVTS